jgi:hypothetical protein
MQMAAALADAVFHQHLRAACARAWVDDLVFFWVRLVANHLIHAGFIITLMWAWSGAELKS